MNTRTLLIIGASPESYEGISIAKEMGLRTVVVDGNPNAVGMNIADHKINVSTYDGEGILDAVRELAKSGVNIDGAIAMCADVPQSVACVTEALNLPGLSAESAFLVADKLAMKRRLQSCSVPIPLFKEIVDTTTTEELINELGLPLITKPVDNCGARGVQFIDNEQDIPAAIALAKENSRSGKVMAEQYLAGPQISTETLIENGKAITIGFSDRNYEWLENTKPYIIENGGDMPSSLTTDARDQIVATVENAAAALGITHGVVKGDMVWTKDGAKVIEIAGRLSGGYFATTQIPLATGVPFIEQAIKLALGEPLDIAEYDLDNMLGAAIRYLALPPGKIEKIEGVEKARNAEGVALFNMLLTEGDEATELTNHVKRAGFVICQGKTKQHAIDLAEKALKHIRVTYA